LGGNVKDSAHCDDVMGCRSFHPTALTTNDPLNYIKPLLNFCHWHCRPKLRQWHPAPDAFFVYLDLIMKLQTLSKIAAGIVGAASTGVPYFFVYAAGLRWFTDRHHGNPSASEVFSLEGFAFYGLLGFPLFMAVGAATFIWLVSIRQFRRS
jgi:hypothetical protein